jgi:hypothetical protein
MRETTTEEVETIPRLRQTIKLRDGRMDACSDTTSMAHRTARPSCISMVLDGATQLTTVSDIEPGGFFRLAGPALEPLMKRQAQHDLETLKTILESETGASSP